jgi:hypothetical protein
MKNQTGCKNESFFVQSKPGITYFTSLHFYQILKAKYLDTFMFVQTSGPFEHFQEAVDIFDDVRSFKVLVIEVDQNPQVFIGKKIKLFEIIDRKKSKKLVIISSDDSLCPNEPAVDYFEDKHYKLDDLDDGSELVHGCVMQIKFDNKHKLNRVNIWGRIFLVTGHLQI